MNNGTSHSWSFSQILLVFAIIVTILASIALVSVWVFHVGGLEFSLPLATSLVVIAVSLLVAVEQSRVIKKKKKQSSYQSIENANQRIGFKNQMLYCIAIIIAIGVALSTVSLYYHSYYFSASPRPYSTATSAFATETALANINPYAPGPSALIMSDPLSANNQIAQWQQNPQGSCQFTNRSYHVSAAPNTFTGCFAVGSNYTDFTYQIQMIFIQHAPKYSTGGILFRGSTDQHAFYSFEVYASGRYIFQKCNNGGANCTVLAGSPQDPPSPAFHVDQMNTLAVVANQNMFTLLINQQMIGSPQTDNSGPYTRGLIGVLAQGGLGSDTPTQVAYSNIKVWQ